MIPLKILKVIDFYVVPQLLVAVDKIDSKYLCLIDGEDDDSGCYYVAVMISDERLNDYYQRRVDLRTIFEHPEFPEHCYEVVMKDDVLNAHFISEIPSSSLPDEGEYYEEDLI